VLAEDRVGDAVLVEDPSPQDGGDGGGDGPRHQDGGAHEAAPTHGLVHDEGHGDAQNRLQDDGDDTEERRVPGGGPEAFTRGGEDVGVVLQADEGRDLGDEAGVLVQARLAVQRLLQGLENGDDDDDRQDDDRGCQEYPGQARLGPAGFGPAVGDLR